MRSHALFPCQIWQVPTLQVIRCISACVYAALKSSISKNSSLKSAYTHAVSYTHLDVYKRQALQRKKAVKTGTASPKEFTDWLYLQSNVIVRLTDY